MRLPINNTYYSFLKLYNITIYDIVKLAGRAVQIANILTVYTAAYTVYTNCIYSIL